MVNIDSEKLKVLEEAKEITFEWVTENRLDNILSHIYADDVNLLILKNIPRLVKDIPRLVKEMIEDILSDPKGEIVDSKELRKAISRETALMVKRRITNV